MASEEISLVLSHRPQNQNHNHPIFQTQNQNNPPNNNSNISSFHPTGPTTTTTTTTTNDNKTTRELTGLIEHQARHFPPQTIQDPWTARNTSPSSHGSDTDDDDDVDDDVTDHKSIIIPGNDGDVRSNENANANENQYQNAITVADPTGEMYYSQYLPGVEGSGAGFKEILVENGAGFSGRKDGSSSSAGSGESLRAILSDPLTGALMDDAMILPCGHSFGTSGMEHVMRMKACYTCSHPVSDGAVAPNLSLRSAVHAFRREEESQSHRASKKRIRSDQDRSNYGESAGVDHSRGRGVQYPFSVHEHVIIQGNKRTPPRFVGRKAVVTTQCLNGWYVVKTLDNAESVKLQYRSLAKIQESQPYNLASSKITTPTWL